MNETFPRPPQGMREHRLIREIKAKASLRDNCNARSLDGWRCDDDPGHHDDHVAVCDDPDEVLACWPNEMESES